MLSLTVTDDGRGLETDFDLDQQTRLGLSIVRTLVTTELNGTIEMRPATAADLNAVGIATPATATGTVVEIRVPTAD